MLLGNGRADFNDVVLSFSQVTRTPVNELVPAFDCSGNGRIDVVRFFSQSSRWEVPVRTPPGGSQRSVLPRRTPSAQ